MGIDFSFIVASTVSINIALIVDQSVVNGNDMVPQHTIDQVCCSALGSYVDHKTIEFHHPWYLRRLQIESYLSV